MRIGIPNILPVIGHVSSTLVSVFIPILLLDDYETLTAGVRIFSIILMLTSFALFVMMSYKLKVLLMTEEKVVVLMPFRFRFKTFKYSDIVKMDWSIWSTPKFGDYRDFTITTTDFETSFSDFEFINFNGLEEFVLDRTQMSAKFNIKTKHDVELTQARENRWWNLIVILGLCVMSVILLMNKEIGNQKFIELLVIVALIIRLIIVFIEYQNRINRHSQKMD